MIPTVHVHIPVVHHHHHLAQKGVSINSAQATNLIGLLVKCCCAKAEKDERQSLVSKPRDTRCGTLVHNKREGQGDMTWQNGDKYTGEFHDDKCHGRGVMLRTCGSRYEGDPAKSTAMAPWSGPTQVNTWVTGVMTRDTAKEL